MGAHSSNNIGNIEINIASPEKVVEAASLALVDLLSPRKGKPTLLLLSGGSAFALLDAIPGELLSSNLTLGVLDERFSRDDTVNNFAQLEKLEFYKRAEQAGCHFIDTYPHEGESQEELRSHFEVALRAWRAEYEGGKIIATMGIGPDGHTAGILPFRDDEAKFRQVFDSDKWVVAYDAANKNEHPLRVTTTNAFLRTEVDIALAMVKGEGKRKALTSLLAGDESLAAVPAQVLKEMKEVVLYTDIAVS